MFNNNKKRKFWVRKLFFISSKSKFLDLRLKNTLPDVIKKSFYLEEMKNENSINNFRIFILSIIFVLMSISLLVFKSAYIKRYLCFIVIDGIYLGICFYFKKLFKKKESYFPFAKYFFTTLDIVITTIVIFIARHTVSGLSFTSTVDITEVDLLFLINILSGLRFDFKLSIYSAIVSLISLGSLAFYDNYIGALDNIDVQIKYFFTAFYLIAITIASGYIGFRAKVQIVNNYMEHNEKNMAKKIQLNLIPKTEPKIKGVNLKSWYKPMNEIGGDFFDYILFEDKDLIGIFISDVSGHGIPAALITSMLKIIINTSENLRLYPAKLLAYLNKNLIGQTDGNFVTAFYGVYNVKTKMFKYARAGHNFPFLIRNSQITEIQSQGPLLGLFEKNKFEEGNLKLKTKDILIFYTDGLVEAINPKGEDYEKQLKKLLVNNSKEDILEIINLIHKDLLDFKKEKNFEDDVCFIGMQIL